MTAVETVDVDPSAAAPVSATSPLPEIPARPPVPAWRLLATLGGAGALSGLLLMAAYEATQPSIVRHKQKVLEAAVLEVLGDPDGFDELFVVGDRLAAEPPPGVDGRTLERVYLGWRGSDRRVVGFAVAAGRPGFQDVVRLIFGYDAAAGTVLGMKVLESKETPGLGDKIEKDTQFVGQFAGKVAPLTGVKGGGASGDDQVDMITGATISSRTVVTIINEAVARLRPALSGPLPERRAEEGAR